MAAENQQRSFKEKAKPKRKVSVAQASELNCLNGSVKAADKPVCTCPLGGVVAYHTHRPTQTTTTSTTTQVAPNCLSDAVPVEQNGIVQMPNT